jgi:superfamily II DNA or RNA helicase
LSRLRELDIEYSYSTSTERLFEDFYVPCLASANSYDRATGYFASSILALAPLVFSDFFERGGRIRLLCSPHLSPVDAEAMSNLPTELQSSALDVAAASLREISAGPVLAATLVRCLSALVAAGALEIKFVTRANGRGIFHDKTGIFRDSSGDTITYVGSANETAAAWSGWDNHEQLQVFRSWVPEDGVRSAGLVDQFEEMWHGLRRGLVLTNSSDAASVIVASVPAEPIAEILIHARQAVEHSKVATSEIELREYQSQALESWEAQGSRGIIAFATGGGKTRTALEAIRRWAAQGKPAVVLVPTELLHRQWAKEIAAQISDAALLLVGAGHSGSKWAPRLADYLSSDPSYGSRIILSTYQTAATEAFRNRAAAASDLLVVADEVHNAGAPQFRVFMEEVAVSAALGLSATPERFGDPVGSAAISKFFGSIVKPVFGIAEALAAGVLVPYRYDFVTCVLDDDEDERWTALTNQIQRELAMNDGVMTDRARLLLIRRARIVKRAHSKGPVTRAVLEKRYESGDRWLIYCGDIEHLREIRAHLEDLDIPLLEYYSADGSDHRATLDFFELRGGVLLAIKCLDEGVDIPLVNKAMILASSANPREYIQRRGRVLRRSPGKYSAELVDVIVVAADGLAISPGEVARAEEFATHSLNRAPLVYLDQLRRDQLLPLPDYEEDQWHED